MDTHTMRRRRGEGGGKKANAFEDGLCQDHLSHIHMHIHLSHIKTKKECASPTKNTHKERKRQRRREERK